MTLDADSLIIYLSSNRKGSFVVWVIFVSTAGPMAGLALHSPKLRRNLFTHKALWATIACCMTFQAVRIVLHPPQPSKGIGMWIFFPFLEVFEMTESAFSVANVVGRLFSKDVAGVWLEGEGYQTNEDCLNDKNDEQPDGQRRFRHSKANRFELFLTA